MIQLHGDDLEEIKQIARDIFPHECCGIFVGSVREEIKVVQEVVPAENQRTDSPANRFLITAEFLHSVEVRLRGTERSIIGFFHSHPDVAARPSDYDRDHAWPWYSYLIVSVIKGDPVEVLSWELKDDRSAFDPEALEIL